MKYGAFLGGLILSTQLILGSTALAKDSSRAAEDRMLDAPKVPPPEFVSTTPPFVALEDGRPVEQARRVKHARELMGPKGFDKSFVSDVSEDKETKDVDAWVRKWVADALPKKWQKSSKQLAATIIEEARDKGFDPIFLLAVIKTESNFQPEAQGRDGEIGLMQVMPATAKELAPQAGVMWKGPRTLRNPIANVRIGALFLSQLRKKFGSHSRLYIAAYNMGAGNVKEALSDHKWPKQYPHRIMVHYLELYRRVRKG